MSIDPTTAQWVDGKRLIAWLEDDLRLITDGDLGFLSDRWERAARAWRNEGRLASVYSVDEFLCAIGVCLGEMPDEFYVEPPKRGIPHIDEATRKRILELRGLGWTKKEIAAIVGVGRETVRRHVRAAGLA